MDNFKQDIYQRYVTTHLAERKGVPTLDEFRVRARIYDQQFRRFLPLQKSARLLDIGCGCGSIVWWLQQQGFSNAMGIDISEEQVESGRRLGVNNLICGELIDFLEANPKSFDVIVARDVVEHFNKQDVMTLMTRCYSALQGGGKLLLQVPNGESPFFGRIRYGDFSHEVAFTQSSLSQILKLSGFDKAQCYSASPIFCGARSLIRVSVWKIIEMFYRFALYAELGRENLPRIVTQNIIAVASKI